MMRVSFLALMCSAIKVYEGKQCPAVDPVIFPKFTESQKLKPGKFTEPQKPKEKNPIKFEEFNIKEVCKNAPFRGNVETIYKDGIPTIPDYSVKRDDFVRKFTSGLSAKVHEVILTSLGIPTPDDEVVIIKVYLRPMVDGHKDIIMLGQERKELLDKGWKPLDGWESLQGFSKKYALPLAKSEALGIADIHPDNIFHKKNKDGAIKYIVVDPDGRSTRPFLDPITAEYLTHKDRTLLLQYVQGKEFKDTLSSIFKAFNLSNQEITYYSEYLNKIYIPELIKGTHSLQLSVRDMIGDPMAFSSKKGFLWPNDGYAQSNSYVRIAICDELT